MKPRILVVDDESAIRDSLRMILEYEDYEFIGASSGQDGLAAVQRERAMRDHRIGRRLVRWLEGKARARAILPHRPSTAQKAWPFLRHCGRDERPLALGRLNEAFGHFIQDSFRNRKEDAQYMTPPEVVSAAVK